MVFDHSAVAEKLAAAKGLEIGSSGSPLLHANHPAVSDLTQDSLFTCRLWTQVVKKNIMQQIAEKLI